MVLQGKSQDSSIIFVTGKGGVGKSYVACLRATRAALNGRRVLLVEMGPHSHIQHLLEVPTPGFTPKPTPYGFDLALWTGEECLRDYVQHLVKVPWVSDIFLKNAWLRSLIKLAPGLREISFLGKLTSHVRKHGPALPYDVIVVDAVSSGHFISLLKTPRALGGVVSRGPMREQCDGIQAVLDNSTHTQILINTNLESYSVQESLELLEQLSETTKVRPAIVANKIFPVPPLPEAFKGGPKETEFIETQRRLKEFQEKQVAGFEEKNLQVHRVGFIFEPLIKFLGKTDEVTKCFE